ncbi:hypothetical protein [Bradyrhizobium sp. F1.13.3]|uniref:hypothetical protein n=1 Tax=Bradyrhizobium sp. F1.13.3 TaxID=3156351 RepID=UPI00339514F6
MEDLLGGSQQIIVRVSCWRHQQHNRQNRCFGHKPKLPDRFVHKPTSSALVVIKETVDTEATPRSFQWVGAVCTASSESEAPSNLRFRDARCRRAPTRVAWPLFDSRVRFELDHDVRVVDQTSASTFGVMIDLTTTGVPQSVSCPVAASVLHQAIG